MLHGPTTAGPPPPPAGVPPPATPSPSASHPFGGPLLSPPTTLRATSVCTLPAGRSGRPAKAAKKFDPTALEFELRHDEASGECEVFSPRCFLLKV